VLRKIAVALQDARCKFSGLAEPALSPEPEKQAAGDDAVAAKPEDAAIELIRGARIS